MHPSTFSKLASAVGLLFLATPLRAYVIPNPSKDSVSTTTSLAKRADAVAQLTAILANPNACPTSTGECVTPADAINPILDGFTRYSINTAAEQAAVVSWMAFESVDFKFNHNVSPGRPGQGTRAMLMPNFIKEYIASMPQMEAEAAATGGDVTKMLALVQDNEHSFASASWYYSAHCSDDVKNAVKTGGKAGWEGFITNCVNTDASEAGRADYWTRACQQLGCSTS